MPVPLIVAELFYLNYFGMIKFPLNKVEIMSKVNLKEYIKTEAGLERPNIIKTAVRTTGYGHYERLDTDHVNFIGKNKIPFKEEVKFNIDITIIDAKSFKFTGADGVPNDGTYEEKVENQIKKLILKFIDREKQNITIHAGRGGSYFKHGLATVWIGKE